MLYLEMAAVVDAGAVLVKATYNLEGDGFLAPQAFGWMSGALNHLEQFRAGQHPNVSEFVRDDPHFLEAARSVVTPALTYLKATISKEPIASSLRLFRALRMLDPVQAKSIAIDISVLGEFPAFTKDLCDAMQQETGEYTALIEDIKESIEPLSWWRLNGHKIPAWKQAASIAALITPTSASVERVFSQLTVLYGDERLSALEDHIEASLMLRINKQIDD